MGSRQPVCPENEGLALYIYGKREAFMQKSNYTEKLDATFSTAYKNVCEYKQPICTLVEAAKVRGIGNWMLKQLKEFFDDGSGTVNLGSQEQSPPAKKTKCSRRYIPQKNSAPYAILITLYRATLAGKEFMLKNELIDAAEISGLSRMAIQPKTSKGGQFGDHNVKDWYSGWNSMKTLVSKGLIVKSSCPARYMLTEEGKTTAHECLAKSGLETVHNDPVVANQNTSHIDIDNSDENRGQHNAFDISNDDFSERQSQSPIKEKQMVERNNGVAGKEDRPPQDSSIGARIKACSGTSSYEPMLARPINGSSMQFGNAVPTMTSELSINSTVSRCTNIGQLAIPPLHVGEKFSDSYDVILILDDREQFTRGAKGLNTKPRFAERLREQHKVEVEIRHLPVGDATWIARHKVVKSEYMLDFIVERKSVDDLWSSIKDTRYKQQKLRLLRCGLKQLIYLVEGNPDFVEGADSVKTAIMTTEILEGFDIQRTRDIYETINRYGEITNSISDRYSHETGKTETPAGGICLTYPEFIACCNENEKETISDVFGVQLMQVRHVTEDIALTILEKYPTLLSLVQAYLSLEGNTASQENLLTGLSIRNRNKTVSNVISRNVYKFFWAP